LLPKLLTFNTPLRYLIVATFGFCVDFLIYAALVRIGNSIYLANGVSFCVGAVLNVLLIRKFVFPIYRFKLSTDLSLTFVANGAMLGVGMGMLWVLVDALSVNPYWAKLLTNGATFILNYVTRAIFFRKK
jgi:putative flippase GtrA